MKKKLIKSGEKPRRRKTNAITYRQWIFIKEYAASGNGADAVRKAGFQTKRPDKYAFELRRKQEIVDAIETLKLERLKKYDITAERVLEELALVGYQNAQNLYDPETGALIPIHKLPETVARVISSIEVLKSQSTDGDVERTTKIKTWDKVGSLKLMGQHLKLFTEKLEVLGQVDIAVKIKEARKRIGMGS